MLFYYVKLLFYNFWDTFYKLSQIQYTHINYISGNPDSPIALKNTREYVNVNTKGQKKKRCGKCNWEIPRKSQPGSKLKNSE